MELKIIDDVVDHVPIEAYYPESYLPQVQKRVARFMRSGKHLKPPGHIKEKMRLFE